MEDEIFGKLDSLSEKRNKRIEDAKEQSKRSQMLLEDNNAKARYHLLSVVKPRLEALSVYLNGKGHNASVRELKQSNPSNGDFQVERLEFRLLPNGVAEGKETPRLVYSVRGSSESSAISLWENTMMSGSGGHSGEVAVYNNLTTLDQDEIDRKFQKFAESVIR